MAYTTLRTLLFASASTVAATSALHAQTTNVTDLGTLFLGWGTEQVALDAPQAVTVIDQENIEQLQATTTGDLFYGVPGTTTVGSSRVVGQTFNIRGFGEVPSGDEGRVVIQQDGATKYYEQYRLGAFFADPAAFCNIEVLRGPASATLYGGGAIGGVIRFETCQASNYLEEGDTNALRFNLGLTSNGEGGNINVLYATRPNDSLELLLSLGYREGDDYEDGDGLEVAGSEFDSTNFLLSGTYHFDDASRLKFSVEAWESDLNDTVLDQTDGAAIFGTVDRLTRDFTFTASYEIERDFGDLDVTFSYSDTQVEQSDAVSPSPFLVCAPGFTSVLCEVDYGYETLSLDARVTREFAFGDTLGTVIYGATYTRQDRTAELAAFGPLAFHPEGVSDRYAAFVQAEFEFSNGLTLVPGLRLEYYDNEPGSSVAATSQSTQFTGVSPKIAFTYDLNDRFGLFGSVAQTERAPTIDELFSFDSDELPALDLDPETSRSVEVGLTYSDNGLFQDNDAFDARATVFYNRVKNLIERSNNPLTPYNVNTADAEIYGLELEAAYVSDNVFGRLAYTHIEGRDLTADEDWANTPQPNLAITIGGRNEELGITYGWRIDHYQSINIEGAFSPTYTVHDLFLNYSPQRGMFDGYTIQFGIDNVGDKTFQNALASSSDNGVGRTFKIGFTRQFNF